MVANIYYLWGYSHCFSIMQPASSRHWGFEDREASQHFSDLYSSVQSLSENAQRINKIRTTSPTAVIAFATKVRGGRHLSWSSTLPLFSTGSLLISMGYSISMRASKVWKLSLLPRFPSNLFWNLLSKSIGFVSIINCLYLGSVKQFLSILAMCSNNYNNLPMPRFEDYKKKEEANALFCYLAVGILGFLVFSVTYQSLAISSQTEEELNNKSLVCIK